MTQSKPHFGYKYRNSTHNELNKADVFAQVNLVDFLGFNHNSQNVVGDLKLNGKVWQSRRHGNGMKINSVPCVGP